MPDVISQPGGIGYERDTPGEKQSADRRAPNFEPSDDERTVVESLLKRVSRAEDATAAKAWRENLATLRRYERGQQTVDDKKSRTNMVYATIAAQIPELYARNPQFAVTPTEAVGKAEIGKVKRFGSTAEVVIRKMLTEEGKLKKRAKANIRSTSVTSFGVLKVLYQKEYRGDPIAIRRIEDTQDNIARIEGLIQQLKKTDDSAELAKKRADLHANLLALKAGNEVSIFKGFTIDRLKSEDFLLLDDNVAEFDEYVDAAALGHKIWMTVGDAKTLFNMDPIGATRHGRPRADANATTDDTPAEEQFICVIEAWDKKNGVVKTTAKGMNRWLREPYAPQHTPQRWYPFYLLGFNLTEGEWRPLSDVELLKSLQDEYDRTRQNYADVREKAVPVTIVRKGGNLSETDVENITNRGNKDTIAVEGNPSTPITQDVMRLEGPRIDPAAYDVSMIRNDMDIVSGRSDASRANLIKPKTATEAQIMSDAMQSRVGERRDTHEDMLSEIGEAALEIALRDLTKDEVKDIAGPDCEWPENPESVDIIFKQVSVQVRAGSSGKPNTNREREQWTQLMPVIKETMQSVSELRQAGNTDMAEAVIELLRETLRRFDEHLDLDSIIPPMEDGQQGQMLQQALAQSAETKQALAETQQALAECQAELAKAQQAEQAKVIEANAKAEAMKMEQQRKDAEAARAAQIEAEEIARRERLELDARERADRAGQAKLDHELTIKVESEKIRAGATQEEQQRRAAEDGDRQAAAADRNGMLERLDKTLEAIERLANSALATQEEMRDYFEAERVVKYGEDGMPVGVSLVKRKRVAERAH